MSLRPVVADPQGGPITGNGGGPMSLAKPPAQWSHVTGKRHSRLLGVSCSSLHFCMAAGVEGDTSAVSGIVERWDGRRWQLERLGRGLHTASLEAISCYRSRLCIAVGYLRGERGSQTLVEEWNGKAWIDRRNPVADRPQNGLLAVTCIGLTWCIASGGAEDRALLILRR
jgi:hypothetical protein